MHSCFILLPPTTKLGQGNIFRSMCQEFCSGGGSGGGGIPACLAGLQAHTQGRRLRSLARGGGVSRPTPRGGSLGVWLWGVSRPTHMGGLRGLGREVSRPTPRGYIPACTEADPSQQMATAACSTHPTGMHSCFMYMFGTSSDLIHKTRMHSSRMHTACSLPYGDLSDRDPLERSLPNRDPPYG